MPEFKLDSDYSPTADQPPAIEGIAHSVESGQQYITLLGGTRSGKTMTGPFSPGPGCARAGAPQSTSLAGSISSCGPPTTRLMPHSTAPSASSPAA